MKISLSLLESNSQIKQNILDSIETILNQAMNKITNSLPDKIKNLVKDALRTEPEYQSLINGKLRLEFGIDNVSNVDIVIDRLVNTLNITTNPVKKTNNTISGNISLTMMKSDDFNGVLSDSAAIVQDNARGYSLPWLQWLLLEGNNIIVKKYDVELGTYPGSRSGGAIMVSSNKSWRVPPEFVGTQRNNWTTRAISKIDDKIMNLMKKEIEKHI